MPTAKKPRLKTAGAAVTDPQAAFKEDLEIVLGEVSEFLISKNRKYGDSALAPINCFSKAAAIEGIRVRMDDKIKRMINRQTDEDEDPEWDLLGYLLIYFIAKLREERDAS